MSDPDVKPKSGHARHDTALIHGLSASEVADLSEACIEAKSRAYCKQASKQANRVDPPHARSEHSSIAIGPYSHFRVGCAVLLKSGVIVQGANVENASYPVGTCAERVAIATAVVQGARKGDIRAIAVASDISPPASPCGMCRQFIREFCQPNTPILAYDVQAKSVVMTLEQLLPMSFGPEHLVMTGDLAAHNT